jgi:hypothetical protein
MFINDNKLLNILFISKKYSQWLLYLIPLSFKRGTSVDEISSFIIFFAIIAKVNPLQTFDNE